MLMLKIIWYKKYIILILYNQIIWKWKLVHVYFYWLFTKVSLILSSYLSKNEEA